MKKYLRYIGPLLISAVFLLADAADDVGVGAGQIGLHHVDAGGVIRLLERLERGQRDEILVPDLLLRGPAERFIDGAQAAREGDSLVSIVTKNVMWNCGWPGPEIFHLNDVRTIQR